MSWPVEVKDQTKLQMEITNYCNAACPGCARANIGRKHYNDGPYAHGINDTYVSFEKFKSWLDKDEWTNLQQIHFCGNYDEPATNPDLIKIVEWILNEETLFPNTSTISIATNGGTRSEEFWKELGSISKHSNNRLSVTWGIDGLEDTNHIYRKNVVWEKLENNFRSYISAGGIAAWQFIFFEHNKHQEKEIIERSKTEKFQRLKWVGSNRENIDKLSIKHAENTQLENTEQYKPLEIIKCKALSFDPNDQGLFITHQGYVLPCCWWGTRLQLSQLHQLYKYDAELHRLNGNNSIQSIYNGKFFSNLLDSINSGMFSKCVQNCKNNNVTKKVFKEVDT